MTDTMSAAAAAPPPFSVYTLNSRDVELAVECNLAVITLNSISVMALLYLRNILFLIYNLSLLFSPSLWFALNARALHHHRAVESQRSNERKLLTTVCRRLALPQNAKMNGRMTGRDCMYFLRIGDQLCAVIICVPTPVWH